jgi:hypothetical protein
MGPLRLMLRTAVLALAAALLVACAQGGAPELPDTSRTPGALPSVSATVPNLSRPPTRTETAAEPTAQEPTGEPEPASRSRSAETSEPASGAGPTTEPADRAVTTVVVVTEVAAPAPSTAATPSATPAPAAAGSTTDTTGGTSWLWWVIAAAAVVVGISLLLRRHRRAAWREELAAAEDDVVWLARSLLPELRRAASPEQAAGGWLVGSARVSGLEDTLTRLEATAPDDGARNRARRLRDAVRTADRQLPAVVAVNQLDTFRSSLDMVVAGLENALEARQPTW